MQLRSVPWHRRVVLGRRHGMGMTWTQAAGRLDGSVLTVAGAGPAHQSGYGHSGSGRDGRVSVQVSHSQAGVELAVETSSEEEVFDPAYADWRLLNDWLHGAVVRPDVAFPFEVRADRWEQPVLVDGTATPFTIVGNDTSWIAQGSVDGWQVTVTARGWPSRGLALLRTPAAQVSPE